MDQKWDPDRGLSKRERKQRRKALRAGPEEGQSQTSRRWQPGLLGRLKIAYWVILVGGGGYVGLCAMIEYTYDSELETSALEPFVDDFINEATSVEPTPASDLTAGAYGIGEGSIAGSVIVLRDNPNGLHAPLTRSIHRRLLAETPDDVRIIVLFSYQGLKTAFEYAGSYQGGQLVAVYHSWSLKIVDRSAQSVIHESAFSSPIPPRSLGQTDVDRPDMDFGDARFTLVRIGGSWGVLSKQDEMGLPRGQRARLPIYALCSAGEPAFLLRPLDWLFEYRC